VATDPATRSRLRAAMRKRGSRSDRPCAGLAGGIQRCDAPSAQPRTPESKPILAMRPRHASGEGQPLGQLIELLEKLPCCANELAHLGAALKCLLRVGPVLERVLIAAWGTRPLRPTVHSAPLFSAHGGRAAGMTQASPRPAARTGEHRSCVSRVFAGTGAGHD